MKVHQIICSCRKKGILKDLKFETVSSSEGVTEDEKREMEQRFEPLYYDTNVDTAECFPAEPAYSFFKLESGRYCICMTKSSMVDIDGYFCHGLITEDEFWPFYPIELYGSPVFMESFSEDMLRDKNLPILSSIIPGSIVTRERVWEFAKQRLKLGVIDMINASTDVKRTGVYTAVFDSAENTALWMAAVQMAFPVRQAHSITFTTYAPLFKERDYSMQGFSTRSSLELEEDGGYYIFDYEKGIKAKLNTQLKFIRIVEMGYLSSMAALESFHRFLAQFDYRGIDQEIDGCYNLFMMSEFPKADLDEGNMKSAFEFAVKYGNEGVLEDIFQLVEPSMGILVKKMNFEAVEPAAEFIFKAGLNSKKVTLMDRVYDIFYSMIDHLTFDYKMPDIDSILKLYKNAVSACKERPHGLLRYSIKQERAGFLKAVLNEKPSPGRAEICIRIILNSLIELGYSWNQALLIEGMGVLMDMCVILTSVSTPCMVNVLEAAEKEDEYFVRIVMMYYNRIKSEDSMGGLIRKLASLLHCMDESRSLNIRKQICGAEGGKLLIAEYSLSLIEAVDKAELFGQYCTNVFDKMPEFQKQYFSDAVKLYIGSLSDESLFAESTRILNEVIRNDITIDDGAAACIIKGFEKGFDFSSLSEETRGIATQVKKIKRLRNVVTSPDISALADFAIWLEKTEGQAYSLEEVLETAPDVERLDKKRYGEYIEWCIPLIIKFAKSFEDHKRIIHFLSSGVEDEELLSKYISHINLLLEKDRASGTDIFVHFGVYYFFYLEPRYKVLEEYRLLEKIRTLIVDFLLSQHRTFLKEVDTGIRREFAAGHLSMPLEWQKIFDEVTDRSSKSMFSSIRGIFGKSKRE